MIFFEDLPPKPKAPTPPPVTKRLIMPTRSRWQPAGKPKATFLDLPMEIVLKIFRFLSPSDINSMSLVCKKFLEASQYNIFADRKVLNLHKIDLCDEKPPISILRNSFRYFSSVTLYLARLIDDFQFWRIFGFFIKDLQLRLCILKKNKFLQILKLCPNLESLSISNFDDLLSTWNSDGKQGQDDTPMLVKLKVLKVQKVDNMSPEVFDFITDFMPNLEHLEITDCFVNTPATVRVRIIDHIIFFCSVRAPSMHTLRFSGTYVDDIAMKKLSEVPDLRLRCFSLTFSGKMSDDGIQGFIRAQSNLTHLDLSNSVGLVDEGLIKICMLMHNIEILNIRQCVMLTCNGFRALKSLTKLRILDVTECERIRDEGFVEGLIGDKWVHWKENLRELHMGSLSTLSEHPTVNIAEKFTKLTVLDLSGSSNCMSDYCLQLINRNLTALRILNLDGCGKISDVGVTGVGFVDEFHDRYATSRSRHLRVAKKNGVSISRLTQLKSLKMSGCYHISDASLLHFRFKELKELVIGRCYIISLDGIRALCSTCPGLESLDVTECKNVTDKCVEIIVTRLARLKTLKLICCSQITNDSLHTIALYAKMLKNLYLRGCIGITCNPQDVLYGLSSLKNIFST